jgi:hypothetical protein
MELKHKLTHESCCSLGSNSDTKICLRQNGIWICCKRDLEASTCYRCEGWSCLGSSNKVIILVFDLYINSSSGFYITWKSQGINDNDSLQLIWSICSAWLKVECQSILGDRDISLHSKEARYGYPAYSGQVELRRHGDNNLAALVQRDRAAKAHLHHIGFSHDPRNCWNSLGVHSERSLGDCCRLRYLQSCSCSLVDVAACWVLS